MRNLIQSVKPKSGKGERMTIEQREWQNFVDLQDRLAAICAALASRESSPQ